MQLKKMKPVLSTWLLAINFCLIILFLTDCKRKDPVLKGQVQGLPDDFVAFYEKFHADSAYQMAHIQFPLEGYPAQADSLVLAAGDFRWTADKWVMHRMQAFTDSLYNRTFDVSIPGIVNETIRQKNTPFGMYRRFYKRGEDWTLILYADMNPLQEN
jgi:Domain of unknown function (DUF4348)